VQRGLGLKEGRDRQVLQLCLGGGGGLGRPAQWPVDCNTDWALVRRPSCCRVRYLTQAGSYEIRMQS